MRRVVLVVINTSIQSGEQLRQHSIYSGVLPGSSSPLGVLDKPKAVRKQGLCPDICAQRLSARAPQ
jgi:hypothetical protein